jgi:hypothetical protein
VAIEVGGWTRNEWRRLRALEAKWAERASGRDRRFNLVGNRATGLSKAQTAEMATGRRVDGIMSLVKGRDGGSGRKDKDEDGNNRHD